MDQHASLHRAKRWGTGLCFIAFPAVWVVAFAAHPALLAPQWLLGPEALINRAHGDGVLQFAHALVTLNTALLVAIALHFMTRLEGTPAAWTGLAGATLAIVGACLLAADKGALCLTMSALDTLPEQDFAPMMPGLVAIFSFKGWMWLVWGLVLMPVGVIVQTIGMWRARLLPTWQVGLLLVGVTFVGFPDGAEIVNLAAAVAMAGAMVPYGAGLMRTAWPISEARGIWKRDSMLGDVVRRYSVTCGLLLVPILLANVALFERLPPAISDATLWDAIPRPLALMENLLRIPVFALPFLMPLHVSTRQQAYGLALVVLGTLIYLASWIALIAAPQSAWSTSVYGFLAPAYTPALWLCGIVLLGQDFSWGAPCRPWTYGSVALAFLATHITHAAIVYGQNYGAGPSA